MARLARWLFETTDARRMRRLHYDATGLTVLSDIPYISDGTKEHMLDIYRPANRDAQLPVIVNIHGGGLFASYNKVNIPFNHQWARQGYTVVSISYRRIPDTTLIHQIEDVMSALRFIRDNSERYQLNLNRCFLTGDSAGALLALYALAIEGSTSLQQAFGMQPSGIRFSAAAFISIMLDTCRNDLLSFLKHLVCTPDEAHQPYSPYLLNPRKLVAGTPLPPLFLVTSAEDIIRRDTLFLDRLLSDAGCEHRLMDIPKGSDHKLTHVFSVQYPHWPESRSVYSRIEAFFTASPCGNSVS